MKRILLTAFCLIAALSLFAQEVSNNPIGTYERKKVYNYLTGTLFLNSPDGLNQSQYVSSFMYSTCIATGKYHQFGLGTGLVSHSAAADTARVNYLGIPIYLTNRIFLSDPEDPKIALYLECHAGYHLPLSGTYQSGNREGQPVPALLPKGTGFYGLTFGARIPLKNNTAMILEFIYRNQHIPFPPGGVNFYPHFVGVGGGVSF
jgi:hypothetical protein